MKETENSRGSKKTFLNFLEQVTLSCNIKFNLLLKFLGICSPAFLQPRLIELYHQHSA